MMKNRKKIILLTISFIVIGSVLFTIGGSLRFAVFLVSPRSAITMEYKHYKKETERCELYKITDNAPYEKETDGYLEIWAVYKFGPLHYSKYFGNA